MRYKVELKRTNMPEFVIMLVTCGKTNQTLVEQQMPIKVAEWIKEQSLVDAGEDPVIVNCTDCAGFGTINYVMTDGPEKVRVTCPKCLGSGRMLETRVRIPWINLEVTK